MSCVHPREVPPEQNLIANAGLALVGVLVLRLGLRAGQRHREAHWSGRRCHVGSQVVDAGAHADGRGTHIAHADLLRAGGTTVVLSHR